jgi:tripartite-type tricarboxylate transporter receptor subunit TctC
MSFLICPVGGSGSGLATRQDGLLDLPTVGEYVAGYEPTGWFGVCAPRKTPAEIIDGLNREINARLAIRKSRRALPTSAQAPDSA